MSLRGSKPERVHSQDKVHYFYWAWDLYKPFDYEPVFVYPNSDSSKIIISRFHWHIATIWTQTNQEDNKPKVNFVKGVHTPIVETSNNNLRYFEFEPNLPLKERIEMVALYLPIFNKYLESVKFDGEKINYEGLIVEGQVPDRYIFNLEEIKASFIIGTLPESEQLPEVLKRKLEK